MLKGRKSLGQPPIVFKSGYPVSAVCVASTFTSVTYADNGGKVQLISAGVHGLTTSPAVGASVYVAWAGGPGISGFYPILSVDTTLKFTIDLAYIAGLGTPTIARVNTAISVFSFQIPALKNESVINMESMATITSSSNTRRIYWLLNGVSLVIKETSAAAVALTSVGRMVNRKTPSNLQVSTGSISPDGISTSTAFTNRTIDMSVQTNLSAAVYMSSANEIITFESVTARIYI